MTTTIILAIIASFLLVFILLYFLYKAFIQESKFTIHKVVNNPTPEIELDLIKHDSNADSDGTDVVITSCTPAKSVLTIHHSDSVFISKLNRYLQTKSHLILFIDIFNSKNCDKIAHYLKDNLFCDYDLVFIDNLKVIENEITIALRQQIYAKIAKTLNTVPKTTILNQIAYEYGISVNRVSKFFKDYLEDHNLKYNNKKQRYMSIVLVLFMFFNLNFIPLKTNTVYKTNESVTNPVSLDVFYYVDSFSRKYDVSRDFICDIGNNESNWLKPKDLFYVRKCDIINEHSYGDLQLNSVLLKHYNQLNDTNDRIKLLELGIKHLSIIYKKTKDYRKTRFIYGRGHWRSQNKWTALETKFMNKMNWNNY